ncbi:hypothetical protein M413DRAFT_30372 [Hebeloma cylindrosporum]|uniref:ribonuclease H n=1 Tax=Hebeloma cylindrosporum TaxID=76867 RepID=A0A0C2XKH2_HEBCY|nr:hypothetical protein M413DRAFT_30372 [Hebeloma cylindrosporum h7]
MSLPKLSDTPVNLSSKYRPPTQFSFGKPIPHADADAQRIFTPPSPLSKPTDLFSVKMNTCSVPGYRFVRNADPQQMLMFVDGSSRGNGSSTARAGYAVVFAPVQWFYPISSPLEQDGNPQTSNRAELRAVLASLRLRMWIGEGFKKVVIACDSQYVVNGISAWILKWRRNGWKTNTGAAVANQDLWKKLEAKLREMEEEGMLVQFWWIPRAWNEADAYAKAGADKDPVIGEVTDITIMERMPTM